MVLSRMNLSAIRNKQVFHDLKTFVTYSAATLTMGVNVLAKEFVAETKNAFDRMLELEGMLKGVYILFS